MNTCDSQSLKFLRWCNVQISWIVLYEEVIKVRSLEVLCSMVLKVLSEICFTLSFHVTTEGNTFLDKTIIGDETWMLYVNAEPKQHLMV